MHNYIWAIFFYNFPNLFFFSKTNNAKIILLIIFYVFTLLLLSLLLKSNFTKERRMYEHIWTYISYIIIHIYEYLYLFMYTYLYIFMHDNFFIERLRGYWAHVTWILQKYITGISLWKYYKNIIGILICCLYPNK